MTEQPSRIAKTLSGTQPLRKGFTALPNLAQALLHLRGPSNLLDIAKERPIASVNYFVQASPCFFTKPLFLPRSCEKIPYPRDVRQYCAVIVV